jgi:hypothetical protein
MTVDVFVTLIIAMIAASPGILALLSQRKKQAADALNTDSQTMRNYQEMLRQATDEIKALRIELDQQGLEITIIKAELTKQTELAANYKRIADTSAAKEVQLTAKITTLETILHRILDWGKRWEPQLKAAGIEPMPME